MEEHGDVVLVQAREALPHVGKATEKSAAWWLTAPQRSGARVFCKTDDDSLIHLGHLAASLRAVVEQVDSPYFLYSYVRWRGWLPFNRLQACGGGWGGPGDAIHQMEDPINHCELAEGPFPQGTGTLTCMSREVSAPSTALPLPRSLCRAGRRRRHEALAPCRPASLPPCLLAARPPCLLEALHP